MPILAQCELRSEWCWKRLGGNCNKTFSFTLRSQTFRSVHINLHRFFVFISCLLSPLTSHHTCTCVCVRVFSLLCVLLKPLLFCLLSSSHFFLIPKKIKSFNAQRSLRPESQQKRMPCVVHFDSFSLSSFRVFRVWVPDDVYYYILMSNFLSVVHKRRNQSSMSNTKRRVRIRDASSTWCGLWEDEENSI